VLHPELSKSEHGAPLFLNEMQILAHLEHPNIVRSLSSLEVGGELVMVLEYLDGQTLRAG
jgi:serine/threonine protein kinase